jgi:xanthine dehydrogenase YagR molybdenum-binding subunit
MTRIEGAAKVTGAALYPSDFPFRNVAYAYLVTSALARGRIKAMHIEQAKRVEGVIEIFTHEKPPGKYKTPPGPLGGPQTTSLESPQVWHDGQIVALVVAESYEAAREAAYAVEVDYDAETPSATFGSAGTETKAACEVDEDHEDPKVGDPEGAFASAQVKIDARYETAPQHHNALELFTTTCAWSEDGKLTIYEASQFVHALRARVAHQLELPLENVRVVSPLVGGGFGGKSGATHRTALVALASRKLGRPVKLVATRDQGFTIATYRAETRHHVRLGASRDGKLQALVHEGWELTSRPSDYFNGGTDATARMYACPNVGTKVYIVHADRNTPGFMRSPAEFPYVFALECAMDELAVALDIDPIELRRRNDTQVEPIGGLPYTSRSLMRCFDAAAEAFGWKERDARVGSMQDGDWLIGWGCAATCYPANVGASSARVRFSSDGGVRIETAAHELGQGTMTALALVAAERLGVAPERVSVILGDTDLPPAGLSAGSSHLSSVAGAVALACDRIRERLARGERLDGALEEYAESFPEGVDSGAVKRLAQGIPSIVGGAGREDRVQFSFGAEFAEVRIHARTREIRVPRLIGAFAAGKILSPTTARGQFIGGLIWGLGSALHEQTEIDERFARYANDNLADYLVAVNADIGEVEAIAVPEEDSRVNALGVKGIGELANTGTAAAIANAIHHATGRRIRRLPIRIEDLL